MSTRRTVRVAEVLRRELSSCLNQCLDLEDLLITISSIELPPDMKQAYVYVSTLNPELEKEQALGSAQSAPPGVAERDRKAE